MPSSAKKAVAASRSSTTMPTLSIRSIVTVLSSVVGRRSSRPLVHLGRSLFHDLDIGTVLIP
ncbi:MAG TPA: hypothetical protein VI076_10760 [Actinopolymorphaceae bacterium]